MDHELRQKLEGLKFKPLGNEGAMRALIDDVAFVAVEHPLKGVALRVKEMGALATAAGAIIFLW